MKSTYTHVHDGWMHRQMGGKQKCLLSTINKSYLHELASASQDGNCDLLVVGHIVFGKYF